MNRGPSYVSLVCREGTQAAHSPGPPALPGVDDQLSRRIVERVIAKRLKTVDELLTIDGMDRELLDRIRPLVRVDK